MATKSHLSSTTYPSPVGELTLIASDQGLRAIFWPKESARRAGIANRPRRDPEHPILKQTATQLDEYFAGTRTAFDIPLDLEGTRFQIAAWRALADIPFGRTTSYGQQAAALGIPTAARALGAANRANPVCIVLPCHRVIGKDGSLTGFAGGLKTKQWLLDHEARVLTSPSPLRGGPVGPRERRLGAKRAFETSGSGRGSERTIVSSPRWQHPQTVQARLSMPVA